MALTGMGFTLGATTVPTPRGRRQAFQATFATKGTTPAKKEEGLFEWLGSALNRDHFLETDPILKKVEEKSSVVSKKSVNSAPVEKNSGGFGGFGNLFAKK